MTLTLNNRPLISSICCLICQVLILFPEIHTLLSTLSVMGLYNLLLLFLAPKFVSILGSFASLVKSFSWLPQGDSFHNDRFVRRPFCNGGTQYGVNIADLRQQNTN